MNQASRPHRLAEFRYNPVMLDLGGPPGGLHARALAAADIPACLALSAEAGWNQTARDWALMLEIGVGAGLFDPDLVATAVALDYGPAVGRPVGFVSMVLVAPAHRHRGLARWLTERCVRDVESRGRTPMLDATPQGQGVYRRLGFADAIALDRWRAASLESAGVAIARVPVPADIALRAVEDIAAIIRYDAQGFGSVRMPVIDDLFARRPDLAWVACRGPAIVGFVLGREGRTATHVGPVIADDQAIAGALLAQALRRIEGPAIVDLLRGREPLAAMLAAAGFTAVRAFTRMHRGDAPPVAAALHAAIGPEFG